VRDRASEAILLLQRHFTAKRFSTRKPYVNPSARRARRSNQIGLFLISILIVSADVAVLNVKTEKIHFIKITPDYLIGYALDARWLRAVTALAYVLLFRGNEDAVMNEPRRRTKSTGGHVMKNAKQTLWLFLLCFLSPSVSPASAQT
jgi:hypothetical protein